MESKENWLQTILESLAKLRPSHAAKLSGLLPLENTFYLGQANLFLSKWFARPGAWKLEQSLQAYAALLEEMELLQADYARTGVYSNTSFAEVEANFYRDTKRMRMHLEALAIAQFLWIDQWERFTFFSEWIEEMSPIVHLEVGPGHGLYLDKTVRSTRHAGTRITAIDVSPESLETARAIAGDSIQFIATDFLKWNPAGAFDTLTMGEVLEHVENPIEFLEHAARALRKNGTMFISSPIHAPMPDHITAYPDIDALRLLLRESGFRICREHVCAVDRIPLELAQRFLKPIMYSAILMPDS